MTAPSLREAAKLALEALETYSKPGRCDCCGSQGDCATSCEARGIIESLRAALAQPDAEPYGWKVEAVSRLYMGRHAELDAKAEAAHCGGTCKAFPLYAAPQPAPVKQSQYGGPELQALILAKLAAPVERKPLTNEQKEAIWGKAAQLRKYSKQIFMDGMNAAESAHSIQGAA